MNLFKITVCFNIYIFTMLKCWLAMVVYWNMEEQWFLWFLLKYGGTTTNQVFQKSLFDQNRSAAKEMMIANSLTTISWKPQWPMGIFWNFLVLLATFGAFAEGGGKMFCFNIFNWNLYFGLFLTLLMANSVNLSKTIVPWICFSYNYHGKVTYQIDLSASQML